MSLCKEVFNGRRSEEIYSEYRHWLFYVVHVFLPMIDSETGDYLHLPYEGAMTDQPYVTMKILNCIQDAYREVLKEKTQQRLKQQTSAARSGRGCRRRPRR